MGIEILNGQVVDPANGIDEVTPVFIDKGVIAGIGQAPEGFAAEQSIDASGKLVIPGLVDLGTRMGEPGFEQKGDISSESLAAVKGGITTLCLQPDSNPVIDSPADIEYVHRRQKEVGLANLEVIGALTVGLKGEQLSEMASLKQAGCISVSNAFGQIKNPNILRRALEYAASLHLTVVYHPEVLGLVNNGCAHEGPVSTRLGLSGIPEAAETSAIGLVLPLVEQSGVHMHFARLSTAKGMNMIRRARYDGLNVTADVSAHQLFLTEMDISDFNPLCHTRPPLRSMRDRDALRKALTEGGIDAICSDHQPHEEDAKLAPFPATEPGISALETFLPLTLRLVEEEVLTLSEAISLVTNKPADIMGLNRGRLSAGAPADLVIVDTNLDWECERDELVSRGKNSPFGGWSFNCTVSHTFSKGKQVYSTN